MRLAGPVFRDPLAEGVDEGLAVEDVILAGSGREAEVGNRQGGIGCGVLHADDDLLNAFKGEEPLRPDLVAEREQRSHGARLIERVEREDSADSHAGEGFDDGAFHLAAVGEAEGEGFQRGSHKLELDGLPASPVVRPAQLRHLDAALGERFAGGEAKHEGPGGGRRRGGAVIPQQLDVRAAHRVSVDIGEAAAAGPAGLAPRAGHGERVAERLPPADGRVHVLDVKGEMVEALAVLPEMVLVNVGPAERLDPFKRHLRMALPAEAHVELRGAAAVLLVAQIGMRERERREAELCPEGGDRFGVTHDEGELRDAHGSAGGARVARWRHESEHDFAGRRRVEPDVFGSLRAKQKDAPLKRAESERFQPRRFQAQGRGIGQFVDKGEDALATLAEEAAERAGGTRRLHPVDAEIREIPRGAQSPVRCAGGLAKTGGRGFVDGHADSAPGFRGALHVGDRPEKACDALVGVRGLPAGGERREGKNECEISHGRLRFETADILAAARWQEKPEGAAQRDGAGQVLG